MHYHFASRFLIDSLHYHGFCYFEALSHETDIPNYIKQYCDKVVVRLLILIQAFTYIKVVVTPGLIQECIIYITLKNSLKMLKLIFILYI